MTLIEWFKGTDLIADPGSQYSYSNPGYTMLTVILENLSNKNHEQFLRDTFFTKLNLNSTGYRFPKNPLAISYDNGKRIGTPTEMPWAPDGPYYNLRGGGGIISTLDDLYIWFSKLYKGQVLNAENTKRMFSKQAVEGENSWYGYDWHIIEDEKGEWIDHSGSDGYKFTDLRYFKSKDVLLLFTTNNFKIDEVQTIVQEIPKIMDI
ncbi:serine hydrolase [Marivirga sp.]|uniref:serine hydrolase domain-containing protein n=1 Tax=Marivirga sp. TaxID=2018662 RepID=UPI0025D4FD48|nr:serine hydrolase domain-containing protein [Marivirga sp.]